MPTWVSTILIAIATTWLTEAFMKPRMDARKARILAAHATRDRFSSSVWTIMACCKKLEAELPPDAPEENRTALEAERTRWRNSLDEATVYLADHAELFASGYLNVRGSRLLIARFAFAARLTWVGAKPESEKLRILSQLSETLHEMLFSRIWRAAVRMPQTAERLDRLLREIENHQPTD